MTMFQPVLLQPKLLEATAEIKKTGSPQKEQDHERRPESNEVVRKTVIEEEFPIEVPLDVQPPEQPDKKAVGKTEVTGGIQKDEEKPLLYTGEVTVPKTVDDTGEVTVPSTVDDTGEEMVPNTVDDTGEEMVPNTVDDTGEEMLPGTVDDTGKDTVPGTVDDTGEKTVVNKVENTGEQSELGEGVVAEGKMVSDTKDSFLVKTGHAAISEPWKELFAPAVNLHQLGLEGYQDSVKKAIKLLEKLLELVFKTPL